MFRKYEKTFRIQTDKYKVSGKRNLSKKEVQALLTGHITVEEKIDGANVCILGLKDGTFRLQKRGSLVDKGEHPQFGRFKAWANEKFIPGVQYVPKDMYIYGEFMWATHHIYYDNLPDWFICIDIFVNNKTNRFEYLNRESKEGFCKAWGIEVVPLLFDGYVDSITEIEDLVAGPSEYSTDHEREGIVVKNHRKQMKGKIVRPEFVKEINEDGVHWMTKWDPRKINKLGNE